MLPDSKGYTSLFRHLMQEGPEGRQQRREEVLATTAAHFAEFAEVLDSVKEHGAVAVVGSKEAIAEANEALPEAGRLDVTTVL